MLLKQTELLGETAVISHTFTKSLDRFKGIPKMVE